jgi:hypothetical protein
MIHEQLFPIVNRRSDEVRQASIFFSLSKPEGISRKWYKFPCIENGNGVTSAYEHWNIDNTIVRDADCRSAVESALMMFRAKPGSYIWTDLTSNLGGVSLGLAVALVLFDAEDKRADNVVCSTGFVPNFAGPQSSGIILQIDHLRAKIEWHHARGIPLIIAQDRLSNSDDEQIARWWRDGRILTATASITREWNPEVYVAASAASIIEAKFLSERLGKFTPPRSTDKSRGRGGDEALGVVDIIGMAATGRGRPHQRWDAKRRRFEPIKYGFGDDLVYGMTKTFEAFNPSEYRAKATRGVSEGAEEVAEGIWSAGKKAAKLGLYAASDPIAFLDTL